MSFAFFFKHKYGYIVSSKALTGYRNDLEKFYTTQGETSIDENLNKEIDNLLIDEYTEHGQWNFDENNLKTLSLFRSRLFTFIAVGFLIPASIFYALSEKPWIKLEPITTDVFIKGGNINVNTETNTTTTPAASGNSTATAKRDNDNGRSKTSEKR